MLVERYGRGLEQRVFQSETSRRYAEDLCVLVNGNVVPTNELSSRVLKEGDTVVFMPEAII